MRGRLTRTLALGAIVALSACASLLPTAETLTGEGWQDFAQARDRFETIKPYESTRGTVHEMGMDPFKNPIVTLLTYSDLIQRFGTGSVLRPEQLERGVRDCFEAGKRCTGYLLQQRQEHRKRIGNFWLDLLNFKRQTDIEGWSFNALIVFVDDQVVHTLYGGQPRIHGHESSLNPLGPLQALGERALRR